MAGVVFIVCIPTENHEKNLRKKKKVTIDENPKILTSFNGGFYTDHKGESDRQKTNNGNGMGKEQTMEKILHDILQIFHITNSTWCKRDQDNYQHVIFSVDCTERCDDILEILKDNYIGQKFDSTVNVLPCSIQYKSDHDYSGYSEDDCPVSPEYEKHHTAWDRFLSSVRARLTVAQVVENVKIHASLTFDFLLLIFMSTVMCAVGLVENSNVYLLSSMVMCPMMGPVLAGTFGFVIQHRHLMKMGVQNELIGLGIANLVGFCYGCLICSITEWYGSLGGTHDWPTYEMTSRGELRGLWVGSLTALLSGAVVALGILSDNIASLVGVAISTSLTVPAVNAGLFWALSTVYYLKGPEFVAKQNLKLYNYYSNDPIYELLSYGAISICLSFLNIICIFAAGIIVFKVKEVAPMSLRDQARRTFWKHDIRVARDYNRTVHSDQGSCMLKKIREDLTHYHTMGYDNIYQSTVSKDIQLSSVKRPEYTWSPHMDPKGNDVRKVTDLYDMLMKKTSSLSSKPIQTVNSPKTGRYRRLSQIFVKDDKLDSINEYGNRLSEISHSHSPCSTEGQNTLEKKRFTVTPCKTDPLLA
nr:unnamed protein product [Callosobruchus chinensis]